MSSKVHFTCTALTDVKKAGILIPDENGYYTTVLGGLNVYNSNGEYYVLNGAKELFDQGSTSAFMRRIKDGNLYAEMGHPKLLPGQTMESFIQRVMYIEETRWAAHISEVWLDFDNVKDASGKNVVAIMGKVKPVGAFGNILKEAFGNPKQNVCFSIRAFTDDQWAGGIKQRCLKQIITFDMVTEPGISFAKKFHSPSLESLTDVEVKPEYFQTTIRQKNTPAMESAASSCLELFSAVGWKTTGDKPGWAQW